MTAVITLLTVLSMSFLITKVATIALMHTGLSRESARFQARSAFTGVGFTTTESESVVGHPVRRRIIMVLILLGNAGIVTVIGSLILGFVGAQQVGDWLPRLALLVGGVALLWVISSSRLVDRYLSRLIERALRRWTRLDVRDYANLLHLAGNYRVMELKVEEGDWCAEKRLEELALNREGILVLGIERRHGQYLGAPRGGSRVEPGDTLLLYGRSAAIEALDARPTGEAGAAAHEEAARRQEAVEAREAGG